MAEKFKVRALRGFRALVDGTFGAVNPGDVVELTSRDDYITAISTRRAEAVEAATPLTRQKDFVPEYKRARLGLLKQPAADKRGEKIL